MPIHHKPSNETVRLAVAAKSEGKEDRYIEAKRLKAIEVPLTDHDGQRTSSHMIYRANEIDVIYSRWAQTQLWNRARIPLQFYDRCTHSLQEKIFNEHVPALGGRLFFRRTPKADNKPTDTVINVRAVLTDSYGKIDDDQVFPVALDTLAEQSIEVFRRFEYDDHITRLIVEFPDCRANYQGADHYAGIMITNSETGHSAVWVEPCVLNPTCHFVNRSVLKAQNVDCRVVHRSEITNKRLKDMVLKAKEVAQVGIVQVADAWNDVIPMARVISFARGIDAMPDRIRDILEERWSDQQDIVKAQAAREIILAVQELPIFVRAQVEQAAGGFMGLFTNYRSRMSEVLEEINS